MTLLDVRRSPSDELDEIATLAGPLTDPADLDPLLDRTGDARFVLLGEASQRRSNWVPTVMGRRYDALCSFAETGALDPLPVGVGA